MDNVVKNILIFFLIIVCFYLIAELSTLLQPLVLALILALMFHPLVLKIAKSKIPNWLIIPLIIIITLGIIYGLLNVIFFSVSEIGSQGKYLIDKFNEKINLFLLWLSNITGYQISVEKLFKGFIKSINSEFLSKTAGNLAGKISSFTGSFVIFSIYYIVFIGSMINTEKFIEYLFDKDENKYLELYKKIYDSVIKYMAVKSLISIATGLIVYFVCIIFGIRFAILWGFITIILNFIPSIGSIIATIPPLIMAIIQFDSILPILILLIILIIIQFSIGNIIEPKIMGNRLKLNTITVIFGLLFWGYIWGIVGMMLSIPLLVILKLIFENIPSLTIIAKLMSSPNYNK